MTKKKKRITKQVRVELKDHKYLKLLSNIKGITMSKVLGQIIDEHECPYDIKTMIRKVQNAEKDYLKKIEETLNNN